MIKKELRALRSLPATKEMMQKANHYVEYKTVGYGYGGNKETYTHKKLEYNLLARAQELKGLIKIALFIPSWMQKGIKTPVYEIFLNVTGSEYITRVLDEKGEEVRWSEAMVLNLDNVPYRPSCYLTKDTVKTLNRLQVKSASKGIYRLQAWQQAQKDAKREAKEREEQRPWDEDMKLVPALPKTFEEWMRKEACKDIYIFYHYQEGKEAKIGYCSRCKKNVPIIKPRHGKDTTCPNCKAKAVFKADGKIKTLDTNIYHAQIIQKIKGGIVIRQYQQYQKYGGRYQNPKVSTFETRRTLFFDTGTARKYVYDYYKNKCIRWIPDEHRYYGVGYGIHLYSRNLSAVKESTVLKQSAYSLWEILPTTLERYLEIEHGNPAVEKLAKIGMFRLARDIIREAYDRMLIDQNATELAKMLRIDNARLKRLKEMDGNIYALRWLQYEKMNNTIWPDSLIKELGENNISTSTFRFLDYKMSIQKCWNYVKKQAEMMDETIRQTITTWHDYNNMADQLKMDIKKEQIAKPTNLKLAHDRCILIQKADGIKKKAKEIGKKFKGVNKNLPKLAKFEYANDKYCIVSPKKIDDIVKEGMVLGHCVHTCDYYFMRIQTDESYLFFLRKKEDPDMPWYTLEVEPNGNIRQKRTTGDKQNADFEKALPFLKAWQQHFKKQLTEEEKELGDKANELRLQEYKELREKGNKVWHGPLAGKLLADVLEADFMEAI